jgi:hypothetical protein
MVRKRRIRKGRRPQRRNRAVQAPNMGPGKQMVPAGPASQRITPRRRYQTNMLKGIKLRLTPEGWAMLKCAFAGFDFGIDPGKGVVDSFGGLTIMQKDSMTTSQ